MMAFADVVGFVNSMQGSGLERAAIDEAAGRCEAFFDEFYSSGDRTTCLLMLAYLAMDVTANVSETLARARLLWEVDDER